MFGFSPFSEVPFSLESVTSTTITDTDEKLLCQVTFT